MAIHRASWADLGFRKLGPLPVTGNGLTPAEIAGRLTTMADYEATSDHWVRRRERRKGVPHPASIEVAAILEPNVPEGNDSLAFLGDHSSSEWARVASELPQLRMDFANVVELIKDAENTESRWRAFYLLSCALSGLFRN